MLPLSQPSKISTLGRYWTSHWAVEFLTALVVASMAVAAILLRTSLMTYSSPDFPLPDDHHKYIYMATSNPLHFHIAPYCWRIGLPLIVKIMPFGIQSDFLIVTITATIGTAVTVYYIAKQVGFPISLAFIGMLLFLSVGNATKGLLHDFWLPDATSIFIITLIMYFIIHKNTVIIAILLAIGVLFRESVIIVAPLYYIFSATKLLDKKFISRFVLLVAPAITALLLVRILIPSMNDDSSYLRTLPLALRQVHDGMSTYNYAHELSYWGSRRLHNINLNTLYSYTVETFGVLLIVLPFLDWKRNAVLMVKMLPFFLLVYTQLLFAGETQRLLMIASPALILLALYGVRRGVEVVGLGASYVVGLPLVFIALEIIRVDRVTPPLSWQVVALLGYVLVIAARPPGRLADLIVQRIGAGRLLYSGIKSENHLHAGGVKEVQIEGEWREQSVRRDPVGADGESGGHEPAERQATNPET
jgi:hypothetical protein